VSREGAHFLGCDRCVGNEGLWASCSSRNLGLGQFWLSFRPYLVMLGPFFPCGVEPQLGGDPLLKF
jgi:hypothetical protein